MSNFDLVLKLFFQLAVILAICRIVGMVGSRLGQAHVVSEMVAGVMLGPSLLGLVAPDLQAWIFPKACMPVLYAISQVGLVLYMFMIGLEFDIGLILGQVRGALFVSWTGIAVPLVLGGTAAVVLRDRADLFASHVTLACAALYLGAAMSITAFPVLARIIHEKGIARTRLGTLALAAGASDDALAWCLLAVVLAQLAGTPATAVLTIVGGATYVAFMLTIGRRLLAPLGRRVERDGKLTPATMATALTILMLSAWATDAIGIYAVFGAFVAGIAMPRGRFVEEVTAHVDLLTTTFFVPVFFVYSGLNTSIGLLSSPSGVDDRAGSPRHRHRRQGPRLHGGRAGRRRGVARSRHHRRAHERAWLDGAHHPQHRPRARHHHPDAVHHHGGHGHRDDAHDVADLRAGLPPRSRAGECDGRRRARLTPPPSGPRSREAPRGHAPPPPHRARHRTTRPATAVRQCPDGPGPPTHARRAKHAV
jgi:Kef-type K+ transport system membrane component KefB